MAEFSNDIKKIPTVSKSFVSNEQTILETLPVPSSRIKFIVGQKRSQLNKIEKRFGVKISIMSNELIVDNIKWQTLSIVGEKQKIDATKMVIIKILLNTTMYPNIKNKIIGKKE